eukprot:TRINITY_DN11871_c0_g1_i1.p1 TRINITY_DN11871_c0_g1~~TRINITY_DN11871_c0_g1_i1.p1  ORF type:complete len:757 (-),score=133.92 TRINITY_DN11871_c0_g1_i1:587-2857(-)
MGCGASQPDFAPSAEAGRGLKGRDANRRKSRGLTLTELISTQSPVLTRITYRNKASYLVVCVPNPSNNSLQFAALESVPVELRTSASIPSEPVSTTTSPTAPFSGGPVASASSTASSNHPSTPPSAASGAGNTGGPTSVATVSGVSPSFIRNPGVPIPTALHIAEMTDSQLAQQLRALPWASFFETLRIAFSRCPPRQRVRMEMGNAGGLSMMFALPAGVFSVPLRPVPLAADSIQRLFISPLLDYAHARKQGPIAAESHCIARELYMNELTSRTVAANAARWESNPEQTITAFREHLISVRTIETAVQSARQRLSMLTVPPQPMNTLRHDMSRVYSDEFVVPPPYAVPFVSDAVWSEVARRFGAPRGFSGPALAGRSEPNGMASPPPKDPSAAAVLDALQSLDDEFCDLDAWRLALVADGALGVALYAALHRTGVLHELNVETNVVRDFCLALHAAYRLVPFHNATWAAEGVLSVCWMLNRGGLTRALQLSPLRRLGALLAAAACGLDHIGFTNRFHDRSSSRLGTLYNHRSTTQRHALSVLWDILSNPRTDILAGLPATGRNEVCSLLTDCVLATDPAMHCHVMSLYRNRIGPPLDDESVVGALMFAVKVGTLSPLARRMVAHARWVVKQAEELVAEVAVERTLGLPPSPVWPLALGCGSSAWPHGSQTGSGSVKDEPMASSSALGPNTASPGGSTLSRDGLRSFQERVLGFVVIPTFEAMSVRVPALLPAVETLRSYLVQWQTEVGMNTMLAL